MSSNQGDLILHRNVSSNRWTVEKVKLAEKRREVVVKGWLRKSHCDSWALHSLSSRNALSLPSLTDIAPSIPFLFHSCLAELWACIILYQNYCHWVLVSLTLSFLLFCSTICIVTKLIFVWPSSHHFFFFLSPHKSPSPAERHRHLSGWHFRLPRSSWHILHFQPPRVYSVFTVFLHSPPQPSFFLHVRLSRWTPCLKVQLHPRLLTTTRLSKYSSDDTSLRKRWLVTTAGSGFPWFLNL